MTALIRLGMDSMSFWTTGTSIRFHSLMAMSIRSCLFLGFLPEHLLSNSDHICSIGLRSGDCAGHSRTVTRLSANHCLTIMAVCLGSLSCWKMYRPLMCNFRAAKGRFLARMSTYTSLIIIPGMWYNGPTPFHPIQPQNITEPPPCFTVPRRYLGSMDFPRSLHTRTTPSLPNMLNFVSSDQITFLQSSDVHDACSRAHLSRCFLFLRLMYGFFLATPLSSPYSRILRRIVCTPTCCPYLSLISWAILVDVIRGFTMAWLTIRRSILLVVHLGRPERGLLTRFPSFFHLRMTETIVYNGITVFLKFFYDPTHLHGISRSSSVLTLSIHALWP